MPNIDLYSLTHTHVHAPTQTRAHARTPTHTHVILGGLIAGTQVHSKNIENRSLRDQLKRTIASGLLASGGFLPSLRVPGLLYPLWN